MSIETIPQIENARIDRKQVIMSAALEVFAHRSYHGASMSEIAKLANVSKGLIYNYFDNKEALLTELVLENTKSIFQSYQLNIKHITDQDFARFITNSFDLLDKNTSYYKLFFSLILQTEVMEVIGLKLMNEIEPFIQGFADYFEQKGYENSNSEAQFFFALMDGIGMDYLMMGLPKEYCIQRIKNIYQI